MQLTERAQLLKNNSLDWRVVTYYDGTIALKHESELSSILQCGVPQGEFNICLIEQCWNGEDLADEDDYI